MTQGKNVSLIVERYTNIFLFTTVHNVFGVTISVLCQQLQQQSSLLSYLHLPGEADHNPSSPGHLTHLLRGSGYRSRLTEPIQSTAYEFSSSSVIPYTSSAYSDIQNASICFLSQCFYKFLKGSQWISGSNHPLVMR